MRPAQSGGGLANRSEVCPLDPSALIIIFAMESGVLLYDPSALRVILARGTWLVEVARMSSSVIRSVINCIIITSTILTLAAVGMSAGVAKGTGGGGLLHNSKFLKLPMEAEGVLMTWGVLGPAPA